MAGLRMSVVVSATAFLLGAYPQTVMRVLARVQGAVC